MIVIQTPTMPTRRDDTDPDTDALRSQLRALNLPFMLENYQAEIGRAHV